MLRFHEKSPTLIIAKRSGQGANTNWRSEKMDWAKVVLTIVGVAPKIAIDAMDTDNPNT